MVCRLAQKKQTKAISKVAEIGVEREGSLPRGNGGVVLACQKQDMSKLSVSLRQAGVKAHRGLGQFKGTIECSRLVIVTIQRLKITNGVSPGQHRISARVVRVDRQALFEQTLRVRKR
jgi:hypothetical protein